MVESSNWTVRNLTDDWRCLRYLRSAALAPLTLSVKGKEGITLLFVWLSFGFPLIWFYLSMSNSTSEHWWEPISLLVCESVCASIEGGSMSIFGDVSNISEEWVHIWHDSFPLSAVVAICQLSHHAFLILLTSPSPCGSGRCERSLRGRRKLFVATF